jgi:hypothetical protein
MPQFNQTAGGIFVGEQLMAQPARIYEEQLPPLNADRILPPSGADLKGASQFAREVYQHQGQADWVGDAADDLPRVNAGVIRGGRDMHGRVRIDPASLSAVREDLRWTSLPDELDLQGVART